MDGMCSIASNMFLFERVSDGQVVLCNPQVTAHILILPTTTLNLQEPLCSPTTIMSDLLDRLLTESQTSEDNAREAGCKVFKKALQCVNNLMDTIPNDREVLVDEK